MGGQHWPLTNRVWRRFAQLDLVMQRLDVDVSRAARAQDGLALAAARNACLACASFRRCRRWHDSGGTEAELAAFCPNAPFLLTHRRAGPARDA
jgi:hypothetical protein